MKLYIKYNVTDISFPALVGVGGGAKIGKLTGVILECYLIKLNLDLSFFSLAITFLVIFKNRFLLKRNYSAQVQEEFLLTGMILFWKVLILFGKK